MGMIKNPQSNLPPGFRFHPTDEELILHYLQKKLTSTPFPLSIIADVDIYKFDPWDLPGKAAFGEKEWYFFSPRDRKYPNGARPNRAAASGYWKATGTDKIIVSSSSMSGGGGGGGRGGGGGGQENLGVKKALVFYKGRPPKGIKTNWIMHEYRLADSPTNYGHKPINKPKDSSSTTTMRLDDWVLCRIYKKTHASPPSTTATAASDQDQELEEDQEQEHQSILQSQTLNKNPMILPQKSSSFSNLLDAMDYSFLSSILADNNQFNQTGFDSSSLPYTTNATLLDQPSYCNASTGFTKLPGLNSTTTTTTSFMQPDNNNKLKRPLFTIDEEITDTKRRNTTTEEEFFRNASKGLLNCCSFTNSSTQSDHVSTHQYNFLNQQFLLSPHLQFQG